MSFEATLHGGIRSGPTEAWMPFTGRQVNTYGPRPQRAFIMDATRSGLPVTVLHQFADATATMRAKVLPVVPAVDAAGRLAVDARHDLVDFVSEGRLRASSDGTTFVAQPWSTPLAAHQDRDGRRVLADGEGRWAAAPPEGSFAYIEFHLDDIAYNVHGINAVKVGAERFRRIRAVAEP